MDEATARRLAAGARTGHLATIRPEGGPHVVVCCFALDGDTIYTAVDAKPKTTPALQRLRNVAAHPEASLLVDHYDDGDWTALWWVRFDGTARRAGGDERERALDLLAAKHAQYREQRPPGAVLAIDVATCRWWP